MWTKTATKQISSERGSRALASSDVPASVPCSGFRDMQPTWVGHLAKSGKNLCKVACNEKAREGDKGLEGQEPLDWPDVLDVCKRIDLSIMLKQMFKDFTPDKRAVRRLLPLSIEEDKGPLVEFLEYLTNRSRAGVVHLRRMRDVVPRTLYLIPPSKESCEIMGIEWEPKDSVIVVVVSGEGVKG